MRNSAVLLSSSLAAALAVPTFAADTASSPALEKRVEELDRKVRTLERQLEVEQETKAAEKAKQTAAVSAGAEGFALKSNDGNFLLKPRGLLQADGRWFFNGENTPPPGANSGGDDTFLLRRVRPILEGTVYKILDFRFTPDFPSNTSRQVIIQDAYVDARFLPWLRLKGGKFKTPFGLERLQSARDIRFVERALPNNLVPNRDIGAELHGDLGNGLFTYSLAWLNGVNDGRSSEDFNDFDNNVDKDVAGRIFAHPFQNTGIVPLQGLGLGAAFSYVDQSGQPGTAANQNQNLRSFITAGQQIFFSYRPDTVADGERRRISPQAYYYYGPFGALFEYVTESQDVRRTIGTLSRRDKLNHEAWQIAASYVITGDESSYKGVKVKNPFTVGGNGWGAWEIVARYSELDVDERAFTAGPSSFATANTAARRAQAIGVGLNWYLNNNVRFELQYENTWFEGGAGASVTAVRDRNAEDLLFSRIQLAF